MYYCPHFVQNQLESDLSFEEYISIPTVFPNGNVAILYADNILPRSDIYQQKEGLAICTLLSQVIASICMKYFEAMAFGMAPLKPTYGWDMQKTASYSGLARKLCKCFWTMWTKTFDPIHNCRRQSFSWSFY